MYISVCIYLFVFVFACAYVCIYVYDGYLLMFIELVFDVCAGLLFLKKIYLCFYACVYWYPPRPGEGVVSSRAGVTGV